MDFVVGGVRKKLTKVQITGTLSNPKSKMIGLKPFTDPIKRMIDVLSYTGENKEEEDGERKTKDKDKDKGKGKDKDKSKGKGKGSTGSGT